MVGSGSIWNWEPTKGSVDSWNRRSQSLRSSRKLHSMCGQAGGVPVCPVDFIPSRSRGWWAFGESFVERWCIGKGLIRGCRREGVTGRGTLLSCALGLEVGWPRV